MLEDLIINKNFKNFKIVAKEMLNNFLKENIPLRVENYIYYINKILFKYNYYLKDNEFKKNIYKGILDESINISIKNNIIFYHIFKPSVKYNDDSSQMCLYFITTLYSKLNYNNPDNLLREKDLIVRENKTEGDLISISFLDLCLKMYFNKKSISDFLEYFRKLYFSNNVKIVFRGINLAKENQNEELLNFVEYFKNQKEIMKNFFNEYMIKKSFKSEYGLKKLIYFILDYINSDKIKFTFFRNQYKIKIQDFLDFLDFLDLDKLNKEKILNEFNIIMLDLIIKNSIEIKDINQKIYISNFIIKDEKDKLLLNIIEKIISKNILYINEFPKAIRPKTFFEVKNLYTNIFKNTKKLEEVIKQKNTNKDRYLEELKTNQINLQSTSLNIQDIVDARIKYGTRIIFNDEEKNKIIYKNLLTEYAKENKEKYENINGKSKDGIYCYYPFQKEHFKETYYLPYVETVKDIEDIYKKSFSGENKELFKLKQFLNKNDNINISQHLIPLYLSINNYLYSKEYNESSSNIQFRRVDYSEELQSCILNSNIKQFFLFNKNFPIFIEDFKKYKFMPSLNSAHEIEDLYNKINFTANEKIFFEINICEYLTERAFKEKKFIDYLKYNNETKKYISEYFKNIHFREEYPDISNINETPLRWINLNFKNNEDIKNFLNFNLNTKKIQKKY